MTTGNALSKAFKEGEQGFINDPVDPETGEYTNASVNPYKSKSMFSKEWERGWNFAYFNNKNVQK